ncbi:MAG TPA: TadG family pilus assembly protein [Paracoccaceae bacterium]|nr:hypothetical protein [Novosphingobium sp.]HQY44930.1 TadG family pilus assembly protein [Paracoccaceae bacterium]
MISSRARSFLYGTDGALGVYGFILFLTICIVSGLSLDVANAYKVRSIIQVAADNAGHTALVTRLDAGKEQAIQNAVAVASENLGSNEVGDVVAAEDIEFGTWDPATRVFTPDPDSISAVKVVAHRDRSRGNGVTTFLLSAAGLAAWDVATVSVYETYRPSCLREGFVGDKQVDIQSNNGFENGFCMHSNASISINNNNYFEAGTIVSMPNVDDLDVSASGFVRNEGLLEALRESFYNIRVIKRIEDIIAALQTGDLTTLKQLAAGGPENAFSYITNSTPIDVASCDLDAADLTVGRIHRIECGGTLKITGTITQVALVTSAPIQFEKEGQFEDVIIATTNTGDMSLKGPAGSGGKKGSGLDNISFGKNDDCAVGGGVQLVTMGGVHMAAGLNMFGSQILAVKEIEFTANADGIQGVSMISADTVSGTSNMQMGFCGAGMENNFEVDYYRLAY